MAATEIRVRAMPSTSKMDPIPHPPKQPVLGNMLSLDSAAPVQHLARLTRELGPIFWLDMMGAPLVIVSGYDLVDELSDEKRFDKAVRGALRRVRAVGGDGLFTADTREPNWSKAHNILLQPFGNRAMQAAKGDVRHRAGAAPRSENPGAKPGRL